MSDTSRSNEPKQPIVHEVQSTKNLHIKDIDRESYKKRLQKYGKHHVKAEKREHSNEEGQSEQQSTLEKIEDKLSGAYDTVKETIASGFTAVKETIIGGSSNEEKSNEPGK